MVNFRWLGVTINPSRDTSGSPSGGGSFSLDNFTARLRRRHMNIVHKILAGLYLGVFFSALSVAQTPFDAKEVSAINVDDSMQGWKPVCILPSCNPGGSGIPTATSHTVHHAKPSKDGSSMEVSIPGGSIAMPCGPTGLVPTTRQHRSA
jgi:hypothetical protein